MSWRGEAIIGGEARSQGSKSLVTTRRGRTLLIDDDPKLKGWRQALAAQMRLRGPRVPVSGAVAVEIEVCVKRPKSHYGTGRNAYVLKPNAPAIPSTGRDVDKVARAVLDSGTMAGWWRDDKQVADLRIKRFYEKAFVGGYVRVIARETNVAPIPSDYFCVAPEYERGER